MVTICKELLIGSPRNTTNGNSYKIAVTTLFLVEKEKIVGVSVFLFIQWDRNINYHAKSCIPIVVGCRLLVI